MGETYADKIIRIARDQNVSHRSAAYVARAEIRLEAFKASRKTDQEKTDDRSQG